MLFEVADHAQPELAALMLMKPLPPAAACCRLNGETENWQLTPNCVTRKVLPAMTIAPDRPAGDGFGATVKAVAPAPVPLVPELSVIQGVLVDAVQAQPSGAAETLKVAAAPPAA